MSSPIARDAVSLTHVLYSEILSVTSTMRKNSRWASSTHIMTTKDPAALGSNLGLRISTPSQKFPAESTNKEVDLMAGFFDLKRAVRDVQDISSVSLVVILSPFFAIIRSPLSTGPITSAALSSLHNFFVSGLISPQSPSLYQALAELSSTVSQCKFEASDSSGDEVVLLKIITVIHDCLCSSVGSGLGDIEMRLSETLRRSAETTMHMLVRTVFSRLRTLDPLHEESRLFATEDDAEAEIRMTVPAGSGEVEKSIETDESGDSESKIPFMNPIPPAAVFDRPQYGLPSILELLRVLINVLDPNDQQHTDSTRLTALGILNSAFEESGPSIPEFPSLEGLVLDPGCKFLFQLARSDNISVLHAALRTISTVLETMRPHLKLQQELFLAFTIDRLAPTAPMNNKGQITGKKGAQPVSPRSGTPVTPSPVTMPALEIEMEPGVPQPKIMVPPARGTTRDLILETLSQISRHPSFMVDLYANYDCDINCENLFERLIDFLTKAVYQSHYDGGLETQHRNAQYICLDLLLAFVNDMAARADGLVCTWPSSRVTTERKSQKQLTLTGALRFNAKPKSGLAFLEEHKLIYADLSPDTSKAKSLAIFLKGCTRLDKRLLGDYISKPENIDILKAFIGLLTSKITSCRSHEGITGIFPASRRAQQIARITETFASIYLHQGQIKSEDAVYVLAYSVIMLNTDLHNHKSGMTIEDYQRNLRGVNDKADFSPEFLHNIYDSIRKREIVMPEEHTGQLGFEYAWKELLTRARQAAGDIRHRICFYHFEDDYIIQRAIAGFRQCATLASHFKLPDVFDFVVVSLSQATNLLSDTLPIQVPNYPTVEVEGQSITISNLSVRFGTNFKGQLAAVVLFNIVNGNGNALREGWTQIFEMFQNLFLHSLLPTRMLQMEDFLGGVSMIPLRGSQPIRQRRETKGSNNASASTSLPSTLIPHSRQLDLDALIAAVRALEALAHERTIARLKQESDDGLPQPPPDSRYLLPYDPASIFLLETMTSIAYQVPQYIEEIWPIVFEHLSALLSASTQYSVLLIERAVVSLLRLCLLLAPKSSLRDQIYVAFDLLSGLPSTTANSTAEQVIAGVTLIIQKHREIISSVTEWNLVFGLIRSTMPHPEAARLSFNLVTSLIEDGTDQLVTTDNFPGLIMLLDEFGSSASSAAEYHRRTGRRVEPPTTAGSSAVERGKKTIELLCNLNTTLPVVLKTSTLEPNQAWRQLTLPLLITLSRQSANAAREIRHSAIGQLQRILLGPNITTDTNHTQVDDIFNRVIFPLLDDLLKPQIFQRDPQGMPETRLRASALLCKTFMHLEVRESPARSDFRILWIQILDLLDRFMNIDKSDQLYEAVPESLKNVVLVMNAAEILVPPGPIKTIEMNINGGCGQQLTNVWNAFCQGSLPRLFNLQLL
ncbi:Sec7-like domain is implicated in guanine nucleotide exchange function [Infundibulicybe gibba]|nr:Sec7-like domain is implicated in guanine nucleotide exchange function [Infundibulicybe gibba]